MISIPTTWTIQDIAWIILQVSRFIITPITLLYPNNTPIYFYPYLKLIQFHANIQLID
jgi:hypothetical protein